MTAPALQGCALPQAWQGRDAWRVFDGSFHTGHNFLRTWQTWQADPRRSALLHYVALTNAPMPHDALHALAQSQPQWRTLVDELAPQWVGLLPGFHRLTLAHGQVLLTLCVGETFDLLREQQFVADSVYLDPAAPGQPEQAWTHRTLKALARCCRRGTRVALLSMTAGLLEDLKQCGFVIDHAQRSAEFAPDWKLKTTRQTFRSEATTPGACAVIGAGLAGASIAAALARRGWQVQVLDQADEPAAEASGLPVGLVVAHSSVDDCKLSRLSRSGVRLMLQQARELLRSGLDWQASGVLERRVDGSPGLGGDWPNAGLDWSKPLTPEQALRQQDAGQTWRHDMVQPTPAIWHTQAAWLKPAALVRAWLSQPGITFHPNATVAGIRASAGDWELLGAGQQVLARVQRVVLANACNAAALAQALQVNEPTLNPGFRHLPQMHGVRGQLSWGWHRDTPDAPFPPFPVNGAGSVIAHVPMGDASAHAWFVGSSYQPDTLPAAPDAVNHAANLGRLQRLLPGLGQMLAPQFTNGDLKAFKNTRCVSSDRLPVLGPLHQAEDGGVWICAGLGSRGLSLSVLCAELVAAQWCAEPWPIEATLAQSLLALRSNKKPTDANAD